MTILDFNRLEGIIRENPICAPGEMISVTSEDVRARGDKVLSFTLVVALQNNFLSFHNCSWNLCSLLLPFNTNFDSKGSFHESTCGYSQQPSSLNNRHPLLAFHLQNQINNFSWFFPNG